MPYSLRLDSGTEALIRRLAARKGQSKAQIVRDAVARYGEESPPPAATAFERLRSFIGTVDTGGKQYSHDTHSKYRAGLERKQRARRPR